MESPGDDDAPDEARLGVSAAAGGERAGMALRDANVT
jgi:hypothetical protein